MREIVADIINSIERIVPYAVEISYDELMIGRNRLRLAIRVSLDTYCAVKKAK